MTAIQENRSNVQCLEHCTKNRLCIQGTIHLASIIGGGGLETDLGFSCLDDFLHFLSLDTDHHESIKRLIPPDIQTDNSDKVEPLRSKIRNYWIRTGCLGFAVLVIAPVQIGPFPDDCELPSVEWLYADTYPQVFDMALKWAEKVVRKHSISW